MSSPESLKFNKQTIDCKSIMRDFTVSTGLNINSINLYVEGLSQEEAQLIKEPTRYLWTDAFAVCNYLGLYRQTGEEEQLQQALDLVDQVHKTLGRHHKESKRHGWISGLDDEQARLHPTQGGLRIGKILNERQINEPFDDSDASSGIFDLSKLTFFSFFLGLI